MPNRQELAQARRTKVGLAVMYLDLDHFKLVNDGLGHSFGDRLIADVARRLERCIRASDCSIHPMALMS